MPLFGRNRNPKALTAAAAIIAPSDTEAIRRVAMSYRPWQDQAWGMYDALAEIHYPANYVGHNLSRFTLHIGQIPADDPTAAPIMPKRKSSLFSLCEDVLWQLQGEPGGHPEILRRYGINTTVAADMWLFGKDRDKETDWEILSIQELKADETGRMMRYSTGASYGEPLDGGVTHQRMWRSHPGHTSMADGALNPLMDDCHRLLALNQSITSRLLSRLAQAGILFLPNSLTVAGDVSPPDGTGGGVRDPFFQKILNTMTEALKNRGTAAGSIPLIVRGPEGAGEKIAHITMDRGIDRVEMELRSELRANIATGLDLPAEAQTGLGSANHWCVDDATEVLTVDGWRRQTDLAVGDMVLTLNHESGLSEWQPVLDVYRAPVVDEPMVLIEGKTHSSQTTPAHRWPVLRKRQTDYVLRRDREWTTTAELRDADLIVTGAPCVDQPIDPKYADDLVELVGWFWTEGSLRHSGSSTIAQSHTVNIERVDRIRAALTRLFGGPRDELRTDREMPGWRESVQANDSSFGGPVTIFTLNAAATSPLLAAAPNKRVSLTFVQSLTPAQLRLFIDVSEMGDGWHRRTGVSDIWQRRSEDLDAYELALILSGRSVSRGQSSGGEWVRALKRPTVRPVKSAGVGTPTGMSITSAAYTGTLWCPVTPNGSWMARRNGKVFYTGNSTWAVMDSTLRSHLIPLATDAADGLTRVFLHPGVMQVKPNLTLEEKAELRRTVIWADSSNVVARTNELEIGMNLNDRIIISDGAVRKRAGAEDGEAPSEDEYVRQLGRKLNDPYLATWKLTVAGSIDWDKVSTRGQGAPGIGGVPPSEQPANPGDPNAGAPGTGDAGKEPQDKGKAAIMPAAYRMAAAAEYALRAADAEMGKWLRGVFDEFVVDVDVEQASVAQLLELVLTSPAAALSGADLIAKYRMLLADFQARVAEWEDRETAQRFVVELAVARVQEIDGVTPDACMAAALAVLSASRP